MLSSSDYKGYSESCGIALPEMLVFANVDTAIVKNTVIFMFIAVPTSNLII